MLDRQKGDVIFMCDECGEVMDSGTSDFDSALNLLKRERWQIKKIEGEWEHRCPNCKSDSC